MRTLAWSCTAIHCLSGAGVFLEGFAIPPDVDQDGNGTPESWRLSMSIVTTPVRLF